MDKSNSDPPWLEGTHEPPFIQGLFVAQTDISWNKQMFN